VGLRDVRSLDRPLGMPAGIEIGRALMGDLPVGVVASASGELELAGSAVLVAGLLDEPPVEVVVATPAPRERLRVAARAAVAPAIRLIVVPGLAGEGSFIDQRQDERAGVPSGSAEGRSLLDRVAKVVDGAATVAGVGSLRSTARGFVMYMRGVAVLALAPEGEGVAVEISEPERRQIHVTEGNFPRWGVDLHETVAGLASDPRLLEGTAAARERIGDQAAADAGVTLSARWLPWTQDGYDPIDWLGFDANGRGCVGLVRRRFGPGDVAAAVAGGLLLGLQDGGSGNGRPRLVLTTEDIDPRAAAMAERAGRGSKYGDPR